MEYRVFDSDGHVVEKDAELFEYLPPPFAGHRELLEEPLFPSMDRVNRTARAILDAHIQERQGKRKKAGQLGIKANIQWAKEWGQFLDKAGIEGTVLYPTYGLGWGFICEVDWAIALARAYNDWLYDRYLRADSRLYGMAMLPAQSPKAAAEELRRCVKDLGMLGGILPGAGLRRPLGDHFYFPIYEVAQELGVPLAIHAGAAQGMGLDIFERALEMRTLSHAFGQIIQITSLMFSGVFDLFPNLRFSFLEGGVSWVPFVIERMQRAHKLWAVQAPDLKRAPQDHFKSGRLFFHAEANDPFLPMIVELLGDECLMYASDFPHEPAEEVIEDLLEFQKRADLSQDTKRKILYENARRFYGFTS